MMTYVAKGTYVKGDNYDVSSPHRTVKSYAKGTYVKGDNYDTKRHRVSSVMTVDTG